MLNLNMCFRKSLFISSFLFFLVFSLLLFSKTSFAADTCNSPNINGLCTPTEQMCQDNGGVVKPLTDFENQANGCLDNKPCCVGGTTCASKGGVCGTPQSCDTNSNDITTFLCPGGTDNVCCVSKTSTAIPNTPIDTPILSYFSQKEQEVNTQHKWLQEATYSNLVTATGLLMGNISSVNKTSYVPGGFIGITNNAIASLFNAPASGVEYLAQLKDNFLGKPAYAQGTGFRGLQPILPIWRGFRNVVYILSSLVFIIAGIMIMLRVKISPQAIITVQSAIPQIIITLILVTFSYAIAGLLIDLSYLIQNLFIGILFQTQGTNGLAGKLLDRNFTEFANANFGMIDGLFWRAVPFWTLTSLGSIITATIGGFATGLGIIATSLPTVAGAITVGAIVGAIVFILILLIIIAIWLIKFWFGLIKCYVIIIFKIVLAPLEIGMGAFPNMKIGFSSWITDLIANLAVFPISYLFLIIANIIIDKTTQATSPLWVPNLLSSNPTESIVTLNSIIKPAYAADPVTFAASFSGGLIPVCIGLATLAILSKLPQMIPEFIFQIKPSPWGKAIGETYTGIGKSKMLAGGIQNIKESGAEHFRQSNTDFVSSNAPLPWWQKLANTAIRSGERTGSIKTPH